MTRSDQIIENLVEKTREKTRTAKSLFDNSMYTLCVNRYDDSPGNVWYSNTIARLSKEFNVNVIVTRVYSYREREIIHKSKGVEDVLPFTVEYAPERTLFLLLKPDSLTVELEAERAYDQDFFTANKKGTNIEGDGKAQMPTVNAVARLLEELLDPDMDVVKDKLVVIVNRSDYIGIPLAAALNKRGIHAVNLNSQSSERLRHLLLSMADGVVLASGGKIDSDEVLDRIEDECVVVDISNDVKDSDKTTALEDEGRLFRRIGKLTTAKLFLAGFLNK